MVRDLKFEDGIVNFTIALTIAGCPMRQQMADKVGDVSCSSFLR